MKRGAYGLGFTTELISAVFELGNTGYVPAIGPEFFDTRTMGDGEGNEYIMGAIQAIPPPAILGTQVPPQHVTLGSQAWSIRPETYGLGFTISYDHERDGNVEESAIAVRDIGDLFSWWKWREAVRLIFNPLAPASSTVLGKDGICFFSASHSHTATGRAPGVTAPTSGTTWSNIVDTSGGVYGTGTNNQFTSPAEAAKAIFALRANILNRTDPHGNPVVQERPGGQWVVLCNSLYPTTARFLFAACNPAANPGDDSLRDVQRFGIRVVESQFLNGFTASVDAITATEAADFFLGYITPISKPFIMLERQALEMGYEDSSVLRQKKWIWTERYNVGIGPKGAEFWAFANSN